MKLTSRIGITIVVLAVLTAGAFAHPTLSENIGVDVWNVPALHDHIEREKRVSHTLESRGESIARRAAIRHELIEELIQGKLTFVEAVQRNLELSQTSTETMSFLRDWFPGRTDLERSANHVIAQTGNSMHPKALEASELLACEMTTLSWE